MARPPSRKPQTQSTKNRSRSEGVPLLRGLKGGQQALLAAGALAGALLSILGLVKALHHSNSPPPVASNATIVQAGISEPEISRQAFCTEQSKGNRAGCLANGSAEDLGDKWDVQLRLVGYHANKPCCELHYTVYQVNKQGVHLDAVPGYRDIVAVNKIIPRNSLGDTRIFSIWIPYPKAGLFRIAFQAFDADGQTNMLETRTFRLD